MPQKRCATLQAAGVPHKTANACGRTTWVGLRALVRSSSTAAMVTVGAAVALIVVDGRGKQG